MYQGHMTEKSEKKVDFLRISTTDTIVEVKRGRGRPKGAKNKPKELRVLPTHTEAPRKRGRPKGAKNKPKLQILGDLVKFKKDNSATAVKKRGRPPKIAQSTESPQEPSMVPQTSLENHPLVVAAKWLEKNMHPNEMQYYRTRTSRNNSSLTNTVVGDILGFFNVQNADICKQVKKNNFIDRVCNS